MEWLDIPKQGGVGGDEETTRDRKEQENLQKQGVQIAASKGSGVLDLPAQSDVDQRRREQQFASILQVPREERDRVQKIEVLTRAAAALAAVDALLASNPARKAPPKPEVPAPRSSSSPQWVTTSTVAVKLPALQQRPLSSDDLSEITSGTGSTLGAAATPGPDFWTWVPPPDTRKPEDVLPPKMNMRADLPKSMPKFTEKERTPEENLDLPLQREVQDLPKELPLVFQSRSVPSLPPLQSLLEVEKEKTGEQQVTHEALNEASLQIPESVTETVSAMKQGMQTAGQDASDTSGVHEDGSRWWKETGVENRANGVTCTWTVMRGVSADGSVEWEEKFWEAADAYDFKELGAEKSGRDASGGVWREFWQESMWQDATTGLMHIQKSADKWAKDGHGGQWHEKWMEKYDASGRAEKWADKWSQIDLTTPLEPGHAHVWHERWGEEYDGQGGSMKYTDKWAERLESGGGWTKWGDKWDERFDQNGHGVKQGETWWEGLHGERWNRTWGEGHNGSGWVHKYGQSSSGEHWDTHSQEETFYDRYPHFGFRECFENSRELRRVGKKRRRHL